MWVRNKSRAHPNGKDDNHTSNGTQREQNKKNNLPQMEVDRIPI